MELSDSFEVAHPIETVWDVLTDVERIAPCLPGAALTGSDGDEHQGLIKVKVGPITSQYNGKATFTEVDPEAHRLMMSASGRDSRGAGNASAAITVRLESLGESSTKVTVNTDLTITGKVAQFGRGVLGDVSRKLMGQFADNLAALISDDADPSEPPEEADGAGDGGQAVPSASQTSSTASSAAGAEAPRGVRAEDVEAVDLLDVAGASVLKRFLPGAAIAAAVLAIIIVIAIARR